MKVLQISILILILNIIGFSQNTTVSGRVFDTHAALIPHASIKAKSDKGKEFTAKADNEGNYEIQLPAGIYKIEFSANYFELFTVEKYRVTYMEKGKMFFDVSLKVKNDTETTGLTTKTKRKNNK